ncbi:AAA family ATPase [Streptomyces violascens]|uniref:AAA family ATPase n=1 Tax=Streptomyces violascens TaxID=67381 RepID=UPI0036A225FF
MSRLLSLDGPPFAGKTTIGGYFASRGWKHVEELASHIPAETPLPNEDPREHDEGGDLWYVHEEWKRWNDAVSLSKQFPVFVDRTPLSVVAYWRTRCILHGIHPTSHIIRTYLRCAAKIADHRFHFLIPDASVLVCRAQAVIGHAERMNVERGRSKHFEWHRSMPFIEENRKSYLLLLDTLRRIQPQEILATTSSVFCAELPLEGLRSYISSYTSVKESDE